MKIIKLTDGQQALVDDEDYDLISQWNWSVSSYGYAYKNKNGSILMHVAIMNTPKGMQTDHINGNKLDNRRENLRICTTAQNQFNSKPHSDNIYSKHKGVSFLKAKKQAKNPWITMINIDGKPTFLGTFATEIEAAKAYNEASIKHHGKFAKLNII